TICSGDCRISLMCDARHVPGRSYRTARKSPRTSTGRVCRDTRVSIAAEIRRLRLDAGLSVRRLAEMAGIDHGHLSLIERGLREPSLAVLTATAGALGGSVSRSEERRGGKEWRY